MTVSPPARALRIAVIGAGIGGLTAAAALRQRGFDVQVYERAAQLGEVGAGLQMAPNAVKAIRALGIESAFMKLAVEPRQRLSLQWDDGSVLAREPMRGPMQSLYDAPYCQTHRADLHRLLLSQVREASIHTSAQCVGVQTLDRGAVARFDDGSEVEADIVVGADGIRSAVRASLFGNAEPRFARQVCWRLVLPMDTLYAHAPRLPAALDDRSYAGWRGTTGHVLFYPIRGGDMLNIFAGRFADEWAEESWSVPSDIGELLAAYAGWHEGLLSMLSSATEAFKWGIHDRDPLPRWVSGRVVLLGDAAHPMMPSLAQGAAISMEDGIALARHVDARRDDPAAALAAFEQERQPRASRVQLQAREQSRRLRQLSSEPMMPVDWIYGYDAAGAAATGASPAGVSPSQR
jgi:salicylate hydroxylase